MRSVVVQSSQLGEDWRASAHCPPSDQEFIRAREAGWECGSRGTKNITSSWATHGWPQIRETFQKAYEAGLRARKRYLKEGP